MTIINGLAVTFCVLSHNGGWGTVVIIEHTDIGLCAQPSHHPCAVREGGGGAGTMACMFCAMCMWSGCTCILACIILTWNLLCVGGRVGRV